jgi:hypothetical protein
MSPSTSSNAAPERDYVFNIVWTGDVFEQLRPFVASLIAHSGARFRFVVNYCTSRSIEAMTAYAERYPDRIVEVLDITDDRMVGHGLALHRTLQRRDDGEFFCFVDADIAASGPFVSDFAQTLRDYDILSSGAEVWTDDNVVPQNHLGVGIGGRHFYHPNGFVYGCPHLAMYRRAPLLDTMGRWNVHLGTRGDELDDSTAARLDEVGHRYLAYDTAKVVNILMQNDGYTLCHREHDSLTHIGGMSHYLSPPGKDQRSGEVGEPTWTTYDGMESRAGVARFTASMLQELLAGNAAPEIPRDIDDDLDGRLRRVHATLVDLIDNHGNG